MIRIFASAAGTGALLWSLCLVSGSAQAQKQQSGDNVSSPPGEKSHRLSSNGPQILPSLLESARAKVTPYSPHWRAFKDRLDKHLGQVIEGGYQGSELSWISDYALGYQCLKATDPTTASQYADKAIAVMKSAMRDYQRDSWTALQFLAATDGRTSVYTLPNADLVPESLSIYVAPIKTVPLVRGKKPDTADPVAYYVEFIRVGDTPTTADYSKEMDWKRNGDLENNLLDWSPPGKEPAAGSTYYVSYADRNEAKHQKVTGYTLAETKVS